MKEVKHLSPKWERIYKFVCVLVPLILGCIGLYGSSLQHGNLASDVIYFIGYACIGWIVRDCIYAALFVIFTKEGKEVNKAIQKEKAEEQRRKMEARRLDRAVDRMNAKEREEAAAVVGYEMFFNGHGHHGGDGGL